MATRANAARRSASRNQIANTSSGIASVAGCIELSATQMSQGFARYPSARSPAAVSDTCLLASQNTGIAPSAHAATCAATSVSGEGKASHRGVRSARSGSTCEASREFCLPVPGVVSRNLPWAVSRPPHHVPEVVALQLEVRVEGSRDCEDDCKPGYERCTDDQCPRPRSRPALFEVVLGKLGRTRARDALERDETLARPHVKRTER